MPSVEPRVWREAVRGEGVRHGSGPPCSLHDARRLGLDVHTLCCSPRLGSEKPPPQKQTQGVSEIGY
jgi:hypothetical protein